MIHPLKKRLLAPIALAACGFTLLLSGCTEPPVACYTPSKSLVDVNEAMTFENCTEPVGKSYVWDFGDGTTSTEANPTHTFTKEGQYIVGLTAKAGSSVNDDVTKTIISAGQRIFASASILSLPANNPSNGPWDGPDNADIAIRFSQGGTLVYQSATQTDAPWTFPMSMPTPPPPLFVLTPTTWTITVLDIDNGTEEVMATFSVNLGTFVPVAAKTIALAQGSNASMQVAYTLR